MTTNSNAEAQNFCERILEDQQHRKIETGEENNMMHRGFYYDDAGLIEGVTRYQLRADPRVQIMIDLFRPFWRDYQKVLRFMIHFGKGYTATARLILFTLVEYLDDPTLTEDEIISYTGAGSYAVRQNLTILVNDFLVQEVTTKFGRKGITERRYALCLSTIVEKVDVIFRPKQSPMSEGELDALEAGLADIEEL